jgi:hypothetical protein
MEYALLASNVLTLVVLVFALRKLGEAIQAIDQSVPLSHVEAMLKYDSEQREKLLDRMLVILDETDMKLPQYKSEQTSGGLKTTYVDEEAELELERSMSENGAEEAESEYESS